MDERCCSNCAHLGHDNAWSGNPCPEFWCGMGEWDGLDSYEALDEYTDCKQFEKTHNESKNLNAKIEM